MSIFSDITDFYKHIENKEISRFICSKMDRISQTYILALEYRNIIIFTFSGDSPKDYKWNFSESSAFNFLFKIANNDSKIKWI